MLPLPDDITCDDAVQWCSGGWVLYNGQPWHIDGLENEEGCDEPLLYAYRNGDKAAGSRSVEFHEVMCHWPRCGSVNTDSGIAVYVERHQRRQWTRTYNNRCVSIEVPLRWHAEKMLGREMVRYVSNADHCTLVDELFDPTYVSFEEALRQVALPTVLSVAVSRTLIVAGDGKRTYLFDKGRPAAEYVNGELVSLGSQFLVDRIAKQLGGARCT